MTKKSLREKRDWEDMSSEELSEKFEETKERLSRLRDELKLTREAYDYNFKAIQKAEKQSKEYKMFLVVENLLNQNSKGLVKSMMIEKSYFNRLREFIGGENGT